MIDMKQHVMINRFHRNVRSWQTSYVRWNIFHPRRELMKESISNIGTHYFHSKIMLSQFLRMSRYKWSCDTITSHQMFLEKHWWDILSCQMFLEFVEKWWRFLITKIFKSFQMCIQFRKKINVFNKAGWCSMCCLTSLGWKWYWMKVALDENFWMKIFGMKNRQMSQMFDL